MAADDALPSDERHDAAEEVAGHDGLVGRLDGEACLADILVVLEPYLGDSLVGFLVAQMDLAMPSLVVEHILVEERNLVVVHNQAALVEHIQAEVHSQAVEHSLEEVLAVGIHLVVERTGLVDIDQDQVGLGIVTSVVDRVARDILEVDTSLVVGIVGLEVDRLAFFVFIIKNIILFF